MSLVPHRAFQAVRGAALQTARPITAGARSCAQEIHAERPDRRILTVSLNGAAAGTLLRIRPIAGARRAERRLTAVAPACQAQDECRLPAARDMNGSASTRIENADLVQSLHGFDGEPLAEQRSIRRITYGCSLIYALAGWRHVAAGVARRAARSRECVADGDLRPRPGCCSLDSDCMRSSRSTGASVSSVSLSPIGVAEQFSLGREASAQHSRALNVCSPRRVQSPQRECPGQRGQAPATRRYRYRSMDRQHGGGPLL